MKTLIDTRMKRLGWALLVCLLVALSVLWLTWNADANTTRLLTTGELMSRFLVLPASAAILVMAVLSACASSSTNAMAAAAPLEPPAAGPANPFVAQVVGLQWLNPLQRRDYPTEWQLLWTLGLAKPNENDDMVKSNPQKYSTLQPVASIAADINGKETFNGYHKKYVDELTVLMHDIYFSSSGNFYNVHSTENKKSWRELAGIHVEYALPEGKLDRTTATAYTQDRIRKNFQIGSANSPTVWSRATPPDVQVTMGGANAGFTSLKAGLDYLQSHPDETVWVMNWDAPSFPQKNRQINENMVLLVLAGPAYKTERAALAWLGYPASRAAGEFEMQKGKPARAVQAWQATLEQAADNAGKRDVDIGYVIHDANNTQATSSQRIATLAQALSTELPEFDFMKQAFNTPALLGEMGAGTALTNVALGIAYANHVGKNVLVAGTSDAAKPMAVLVAPPAVVRPINPDKPWFRARGENNAYLMWWGIRHDDKSAPMQGYSR